MITHRDLCLSSLSYATPRVLHIDLRSLLKGTSPLTNLSTWTGFTVDALARLADAEEIQVSGKVYLAIAYLAKNLGYGGDFFDPL
jgi:hypothetical protein